MNKIISEQQIPYGATPTNKWSSLFTALPRNAGDFSLRSLKIIEIDEATVPLDEVLEVGVEFLSDYLMAFFLDSSPLYQAVTKHCSQYWKFRG